jgi:hypothetical protein
MKKAVVICCRVILGAAFVVFGLNGFLHFIPMPPPAAGSPAAVLWGGFFESKYMVPLIFGTQAVSGLLILSGIFLPLGLILLAPVLVNILLFHLFLEPAGIVLPVVLAVLYLILVSAYWSKFKGLLSVKRD